MNKKLIALAVGAAMAAPLAAQAEATVYGKINMAVVSYDDDNTNDGIGLFDEASRLGVKGSEDLGNGMSMVFKMEGTADMDSSANFNLNRDSYIGLKGSFGTVMVGRKNTAYKNATGKMDLFADMYGDITGKGTHGFADQREQGIFYENKFGMVKLAVDLHPAEQGNNPATAIDEAAMGNTIALSFAPMEGLNVAIASGTCGGTCEAKDFTGAAAAAEGDSAFKVGVQWKGGPHTVNFVHETGEEDASGFEFTAMTIQYGLAMGANSLQLSHTMTETDPGTADTETTQTSVALVHKMSKATKVYVAYSAIDNGTLVNAEGRLDSGISNHGTGAGQDPSGIALGITTNF